MMNVIRSNALHLLQSFNLKPFFQEELRTYCSELAEVCTEFQI